MKIILDNIIYSLQKSGGGSVYWTELLKRFKELKEEEVVFVEQIEPHHNLFRKDLTLPKVEKESFLKLGIRRYLNFTLPIQKKSIFHSSYFRISTSKNAINVTTVHDFTTEKFRSGLARFVNLYQKKHAVLNSSGIICISENTKQDLLKYVPKVDPDKIRVIYNGVSDDFFPIEEDFFIQDKHPQFKDLTNYNYVLYIGHRTSYKNFDLAVKAVAQSNKRLKLVIIGEQLSKEELLFVERQLGDRYVHLSGLNNEYLNFLYNRSYALLYPSSYEGFGIPLVEAMKTHCPIIAFRNSSIPEVVGDAGTLFDEINELSLIQGLEMLEDQDYRSSVIQKGIIQSKKFNWDHTFAQYLEFYKKLYYER